MNLAQRYSHWLSAKVAGLGLQQSLPLYTAAYRLPALAMEGLLRRWPGLKLMPELGLFEGDDLLGWRLRPRADSLYATFDVRARHTTDAQGRRTIPTRSSGPPVYLLGCSVTFGFCVDDGESFAARLGNEFRVENHAVPGYGTAHQYLLLLRRGLLARAAASKATIVYAWYPMHTVRVWRRRSWLQAMELSVGAGAYRGSPLFEVDRAGLRHQGLIRLRDAVPDRDPLVPLMEWRITSDLLAGMAGAARDAGVRFLVAVMPYLGARARTSRAPTTRMIDRLERLGIESLDLTRPDGVEPHLEHPFTRYPTAQGHGLLAQRLVVQLRDRLRSPANRPGNKNQGEDRGE
jgi:hypothetical protein